METIESYAPGRDAEEAFRLWQVTLDDLWPLPANTFHTLVNYSSSSAQGHAFVARREGALAGFVSLHLYAGDSDSGPAGSVSALLVAPQMQHQGIGTALHETALGYLKAAGVGRAQLGGGGAVRFWPGVPGNLPHAVAFFGSLGWRFEGSSYDLVLGIRGRSPAPVPIRYESTISERQVKIEVARPDDLPEVLSFESSEFPHWRADYEDVIRLGDCSDILLARGQDETIIGALLMYSPQSHAQRIDVVWKSLLGKDAGGLGAVGVAAAHRGGGIGSQLVAGGTRILAERGAARIFIGWTDAVGFYSRLGYRKWQDYAMSWRNLDPR